MSVLKHSGPGTRIDDLTFLRKITNIVQNRHAMNYWGRFWGGLLVLGLLLGYSCQRPDDFTTNPEDMLAFSLDTLRFDTVFTSLGSATRSIKVYNRANRAIRISSISVASGAASKFRINVDGIPGNEATDVEILANDSI